MMKFLKIIHSKDQLFSKELEDLRNLQGHSVFEMKISELINHLTNVC
jgi:hypothetical protein